MTSRSVQVRRATSDDVEALLALMRDFHAESGFALDPASAGPALRSLLASPSLGCIWLAFADDVAVGHAVLTVRFTMEHEGLSGYVDDLYVRPTHRRQGVARRLLGELLAECRIKRCKALHVEVGGSNSAALALYAELGLRASTDGRILASGPVAGVGV